MNKSSFILLSLAIVAGFFVAFIVDPLDSTTLSTPFCLGLALMAISIRQSSRMVFIVSLIYCALVFYSLVQFINFSPYPVTHPVFWFYQRFGLFIVVCMMALYLSHYREETQRNLTHMHEILGKLPVPVAISDAAGYITYTNERLCVLMERSSEYLKGKRYVDLFMTDIQEGKAMRYYIELFGDASSDVHDMKVRIDNTPDDIDACLTCLGSGVNRNMITVLQIP